MTEREWWWPAGPGEVGWLLVRTPLMARELPGFDAAAAPEGPGELFAAWLAEAVAAGVLDPHAMTLATVGLDGVPDARVVALRNVDVAGGGWVFAASSDSPKGRQLTTRAVAAMTCYWPAQGRQVRLRGRVETAPAEVAAAEFRKRSPRSRVAGLVARQSEPLESTARYEAAAAEAERRLAAEPDAVPPGHSVYALWADEVEFWQGDAGRRHVRLRYRRAAGGAGWRRELLWP
ncbi:pyridoxal 5'-phosphate synthase [Streptomyces sp. NPDC127098]|uniref:pyridoxine/pyridoxamine 5'-phosphate oxidase n=1 Tax=Streptomyces sp. NPDC127098 TaxID=3347137 RepID=UPI00364E2FC9